MTTTTLAATTGRRWQPFHLVVALCFAAVFISYIDRTNISVAAISMKDQFGWTETVKGFVLSSFFVGYIVLQVAAGTLANRLGGKLVLGVAVVWWSLFTVLTPPAAMISLPLLIAARICLGLGEAAVFPASINMVGCWVPAENRSRAVAVFTSALSLGTVFSLPVTGWLIRSYGWPIPFYAFGAVGLVWAVIWFTKIGRQGPFDARTEVAPTEVRRKIPWGVILRTPAVWAIITNHFANNWALYMMLAWLPSYFKTTFGISLANAGLYSAAPWLTSFVVANIAGSLADRLLKRGMSPTAVRKLMQGLGLLGTALFLLLLRGAPSVTVGVVLMSLAAGMEAFCYAGFAPNAFDIAPKYADVIWGISNTFATVPGIIGVAVTGWLLDRTGSFTAPFMLTAAINVIGALIYFAIGSGRRQIE